MLKYTIVKLNLSHEEKIKEEEWKRKVEWERMITLKPDTPEDLRNELTQKDNEIKELKRQLEASTQLDIERITLLVHSLPNNREYWTTDKIVKLLEQVKNTQEAIKKYLK